MNVPIALGQLLQVPPADVLGEVSLGLVSEVSVGFRMFHIDGVAHLAPRPPASLRKHLSSGWCVMLTCNLAKRSTEII